MGDERATHGKAANGKTTNGKDVDPMAAFRDMRDNYLDAWSKSMVDAVNTDAYAKASGIMLDTYLSASSPFREVLEKSMVQALQQLSMPSRADVLSLAERLINIEMQLDDMDAKLDHIEKAFKQPASAARVRRRAPTAGSRRKGTR